ncbi:MAG: bifunctional riboflavin kinase/FAD synthetase [Nitrospinae bacterium]|nr:bifunctional riboflavin kinase/FAD synthetase [Nitrospinota bacterium]
MKIIRGSKNIKDEIKNPVLTLGNFDGVHIGHREIFRQVIERAKEIGGTSIVYTFEPHPLRVVSPAKTPPLLTTFKKKMQLIAESGIDITVCADFTKRFAEQHPRDFAGDTLIGNIGVKEVFVGYDYTFGKGREGTITYLKKMGEEFGFKVTVIDAIMVDDQIVSSTLLRDTIEEGDVEKAKRLLGRRYSIEGKVADGFKTGSMIGFPTANIDTSYELIPHTGVYAAKALIDGEIFDGVANVGFNPTFHRDKLNVEIHIFNFTRDIYGKEIEIFFIKMLRNEIEFGSAGELKKQIEKDITIAKGVLNSEK